MWQTDPDSRIPNGLETAVVVNDRSSCKSKQKRRHLYTEGERNKLIDSIMDPLSGQDDIFILFDSLLHFLNEGDPEESMIKFTKYTLPELLRRWFKKRA